MTTRHAAACLQPALAQPGMDVQSSSPGQPADLFGADAEKWRCLIKTLGFPAGS